ncbi:hypothetical protein GCM10010911_48170 [Paenibacillus nasutitermitis]|uniref:Uncharacterized protein n=1 Tax=Paenibacillus nasutitermitis TaxID=1652958 RepID=A0A917DZP5_9BACL|nr:hypothetical protein GCM10010911_48170 [Paenibacillus nasutitermitis]
MAQDGIFLTLQSGELDCREINETLGVPLNEEYKRWNLYAAKLYNIHQIIQEHGFFDVTQHRFFIKSRSIKKKRGGKANIVVLATNKCAYWLPVTVRK